MSRFVVVVVVILVIAFLANKYLIGEGDAPPGEDAQATSAAADGEAESSADSSPGDPNISAGASADGADQQNSAAEPETEASPASRDASTDQVPQEHAGEEAVEVGEGDSSLEDAGSDADAPAEPVDGADLEDIAPESESDATLTSADESTVQVSADVVEEVAEPESIMLGGSELLDGIPGEGDLTLDAIEAWLKDPKNHVVLKPELPLGLAAGAGEIKGVQENPLTRAKIELGRQLYFDPRLSVDATISCASCHAPQFGYAFNSQFGIGVDGQEGGRNSPVAYNRIVSGPQFWDGRAESLEAQAVGPIENPIEMANTHDAAVERIKQIPGYVKQFDAIFDDGATIDNVGKAIASFERAIVTGPAPWDYYLALKAFEEAWQIEEEFLDELKDEDPDVYQEYMDLKSASEEHPITESAIRGGELFFSDKAGCTACHVGANFSDEKYHNLGVGMDAEEPDLGRFVVTGKEEDRGAFKTPTVRNVAVTAPYMHDGSQQTLEEVVEWYAKGGHPNKWLSKDIRKLELADQDKRDLVEFMKQGLTGAFPEVETSRLPADVE